ncbi:cation:proton antiporter [Sphingomonas sp. ID0503]|uniref:cation:proton antiporter domain-containing protein n=1 Tax=Sphingomonas sp. ID0503 TaxID=3399691 RepID=UPI003AFAC081
MEQGGTHLLHDGVVLLGAALASVLLFRKLGLGAVLGYLVAGVAIGPYGLGLVGDAEQKLGIAELGITLLLFIVGLELHPSRLWRLRKDIFGFGLAQVVLCGLALCVVVFAATPLTWPAIVALALPLALSSTAQVLPMLRSAGRLNTPFGERAFSILLFQDLSIVPLITIIAALSRAPADPSAPPGWLLGIYTVLAIGGLVLAGRFILNPLFRLIGRLGEREMFVVAGLFTVLAAATVMELLHLSTALGAFVAGVMLADSPYRHELESDVEPFRSILLGLFFLAVGMLLDVDAILHRPALVIGVAAALIAVKTGIIFAIARLFGMSWRQAFSLGLLLSQGGEFGFVLFGQAQAALLIAPEAASLFSAVVTLSMATTPFLMEISRRFRTEPAKKRDDLEGPEKSEVTPIVIVGYGRFGQTVAQMLTAKKIPVTLIDTDPEMIDIAGMFGAKVFYGDGTRIDLLRHAGVGEAQILVFCHNVAITPDHLRVIAETFPETKIFMRVYDRRQLIEYGDLEVAGSVREVFESAVRLARDVMDELDIEAEEINRAEEEYRKRDGERLAKQRSAGDLYAAREMMFRPSSGEQ